MRGMTLIEVLIVALIMTFLTIGVGMLYTVGQRQQRISNYYSQVQTDMREGLRRVTRTLRHGYEVVGTSTAGTLNGLSSSTSQIIVRVPEPTGAATTYVHIRFYVSGSVLYSQRQDQSAPGVALLDGVQTLAFNYFDEYGANMNATPTAATRTEIVLTARRGPATTTVRTLVTLRNRSVGL